MKSHNLTGVQPHPRKAPPLLRKEKRERDGNDIRIFIEKLFFFFFFFLDLKSFFGERKTEINPEKKRKRKKGKKEKRKKGKME